MAARPDGLAGDRQQGRDHVLDLRRRVLVDGRERWVYRRRERGMVVEAWQQVIDGAKKIAK